MTVDEKLDFLIASVTEMKQDIAELKEDVATLKKDVVGLKDDVISLKTRMDNVESITRATKFIIDNEVCVNIVRIAEGHFDLNRKLDQYYGILQEQVAKNEKNDLYITSLRAKMDV